MPPLHIIGQGTSRVTEIGPEFPLASLVFLPQGSSLGHPAKLDLHQTLPIRFAVKHNLILEAKIGLPPPDMELRIQ